MATEWIIKAANQYRDDLYQKRKEDAFQRRRGELEQYRLNRIATEGKDAGSKLWDWLQSLLKSEVAEFNKEFGEDIMRTEARADGTFKVCFGEDISVEKVAVLNYAVDKAALSWEVFGGAKAKLLTVGLEKNNLPQANTKELQFTTGDVYYTVPEISKSVISSLLD